MSQIQNVTTIAMLGTSVTIFWVPSEIKKTSLND